MVNKKIKERQEKLLELTRSYCEEKLDDEYLQLCEKLINKMGRKREVPFKRGKLDIWAAAVVHAVGSVNFLFDKSFEPYASVSDINDYFGTNTSTVSQKSKRIRDMFSMSYFDSEFSTTQMNDNNPFNNMVMVDGYIVPLDFLPEQDQEMVREARARGEDIEFFTEE
ncbi:MAG: DUF6398 domain-containing protein [Balneolaceae bacterium]|nr:DUF6398 domain-containing protein [Balneolaceae bacterium]MDR9410821.1 DUF6398 domain-containing protein [Balneolaceae bacterium]